MLTNVALQVPVVAADPSSAQLEADLLKANLQLTHARLHLADLVRLPHPCFSLLAIGWCTV